MRWLVTGAAGMLGRDVVSTLHAAGEDATGMDRRALDVTDRGAVADAVAAAAPDVVVNCAGWTDVDGAEEAESQALAVNGDAVANLAVACSTAGARLLHVSTDYVFDGRADAPYPEDATPDPLNAYGRSKLAGERAVLELLPSAGYVVRTAWLYGEHGPNFVATMLRLEQERETLDVVDDQVGQPTWTMDLARQLVALGLSHAPAGIYHATNSGQTSWHNFACEIFRMVGADPERLRPTTAAAFRRPAPRPAYSVLGQVRWTEAGLTVLRPWEDALAEALPRMAVTV